MSPAEFGISPAEQASQSSPLELGILPIRQTSQALPSLFGTSYPACLTACVMMLRALCYYKLFIQHTHSQSAEIE